MVAVVGYQIADSNGARCIADKRRKIACDYSPLLRATCKKCRLNFDFGVFEIVNKESGYSIAIDRHSEIAFIFTIPGGRNQCYANKA